MSKPRSDSWLRTLTQERQDQVIEWCERPADRDGDGKAIPKSGGYDYARAQLAADGISVAIATLGDFYSWYYLRRNFARADQKTQDYEDLLRKEFPTAEPGKIQKIGQDYFTLQAMAMSNAEEFREMEYLKLAKDTALTRGRQKEEELTLKKKKFQRDSAKLFLVWIQDEEAKRIALSGGTKAEKIEALGRHLFDDWDEN